MAAILPNIDIDSDSVLARYYLPYQLMWINDDSTMRLAEKSVRIGWTFCDQFKNVRKRLRYKNRDYLFATKDQQSAIEYLDGCKKTAELFDYTRSIVSHGMDDMRVESIGDDGKKFTEEVKFGYIKFDNGSRIIAFSANPYAMAVFGGDVGLDEFAKHQRAEKLWETAQGRITWGYDIGVWSAHDGTGTMFYQFALEARAGKGGWSHYRVTMEDAVEMGLVEKISAVSGKPMTREQFIQDCKNRARLPEIYEQSYNCNPSGSASAIVPWLSIQSCRIERKIERFHFEAGMVSEMFGVFDRLNKAQRRLKIANFIKASFAATFNTPGLYRVGFDVAASGEGDLASIYVDQKDGGRSLLSALFTCRTDDWDFIKSVLWTFMRNLSSVKAAGDETGLGRQICWMTTTEFPNQFEGVNFSSKKHDMGFALMNQLQTAEKCFPLDKEHDDIAQDYFGMRKIWSGGRWHFSESRNSLNPASHCDIAWSGALATKADELGKVEVRVSLPCDDGREYF